MSIEPGSDTANDTNKGDFRKQTFPWNNLVGVNIKNLTLPE